MNVQIPKEKVDLSDCHVGLDFPAIEQEVRKIATEFVQGVLESNVSINIQPDLDDGKLHVVLWFNLYDAYDTPVASVPVNDLFEEYLKTKGEAKQ
jgi:hypothetical protein